jgi:threonine/homoserine/homoserine lactone efflux protein
MEFSTIITFCLTLVFFMASPGPGTFAVVARGIGSGFSHAFAMVVAMALGDLIYLLLAIFGLSAVAHLMGDFFLILKYIGGFYLIYLGFKIFFSKNSKSDLEKTKSSSYRGDFLAGLLICLSNPKVILFYLGVVPLFVELDTLRAFDIFVLSFLVVFILIAVLGSYAYFAAKAKNLASNPKKQNIINKVAGSMMMGAGVGLILKS